MESFSMAIEVKFHLQMEHTVVGVADIVGIFLYRSYGCRKTILMATSFFAIYITISTFTSVCPYGVGGVGVTSRPTFEFPIPAGV